MTDKTFNKYKLVVDEWFVNGFNGTKAYQKFYPKVNEDTAAVKFNNLVSIGKIVSYKEFLQEKIKKATDITHQDIINDLQEIKDRCMQKIPVMLFDSANKTYVQDVDSKTGEGIWKFDPNPAIKAIENLGRHIGFYEKDNTQKKTESKINLIVDNKKTKLN